MKSKDELIHEIGKLVVQDDRYGDHVWSAISIVGRVRDDAASITGYLYDGEEEWEGATPNSMEFPALLQELRRVMQADVGGDPWKSCLIQIKREDLSVGVKFEYENEDLWTNDLPTLHDRLRPS